MRNHLTPNSKPPISYAGIPFSGLLSPVSEPCSVSRGPCSRPIGKRQYELTDHSGNVMLTVSDRKDYSIRSSSIYDSKYHAIHLSFTDYYPFGFPIAERSWTGNGYRFGFNGQEKDDEIYGEGSAYGYEFRMYDSRLGRWWGVDRIGSQFPWSSPYVFVENDVIRKKDVGGKYGSDGHYWTVYAMGVMMGLSNEDAVKYAVAAEAYDNIMSNTGSIQNTRFFPTGTYLPFATGSTETQGRMHGLTGGSQQDVNEAAHMGITNGNLYDLHLLGDSYAHATESSGYTKMYPPFVGHTNKEGRNSAPDNIAKHSEQYMKYINDLGTVMAGLTGFEGGLDKKVFEEVAKYQSEDVRTGILKSYIASNSNVKQQLSLPYNSDLEKALNNLGIEYSITTTKKENTTSYGQFRDTYTTEEKQININGQ